MFLVDGSNHAFRVQFALPPQHTSEFFPTRVLYGFTLLLQKMLRTWEPDYCLVAFDSGETFRHQLLPSYKGHRPEMPADLRQQWPYLEPLVKAFGVQAMTLPGYEADDILGTLARRFASPEVQVFIVSSDKDFAQLVGPHVSLLDEGKGKTTDPEGVFERFGVRPDQIIDWLGLQGDASDNIPGVPGVGEKTAVQLLSAYGTLEGVLAAAAAGKVKGKRGEALVAHADSARLSARLATIRTDLDLALDLDALAPRGLQEDPLRELFDRFEFGPVARKLLPAKEAIDRSRQQAVADDATLTAVMAGARAARLLSVDPVVRRSAEGQAAWHGLGLAFDSEQAAGGPAPAGGGLTESWWIPLAEGAPVAFDRQSALESVRSLLTDPAVPKIGHDVKRHVHDLWAVGIELAGVVGDIKLLDYVLVAHRRTHDLESISQRHLGHTLAYVGSEPEDLQEAGRVYAETAHVVQKAYQRLVGRLDAGSEAVYRQIELPLTPVLARMERVGVRLDTDALGAIRTDLARRAVEAERLCHDLAGREFKVNSPKEVGDLLFTELGLPPSKKTATGTWSTDSQVLEGLADLHPLPAAILEHRMLQKLEGTYLAKLPQYVAADGRIHTTLHQTGAATGRLSSADPNLQNIPIRSFEGRRIREAFVPAPGFVLLSFDYSQVELRILAHYCGSPALQRSFLEGEDIHRRTASEVWGVPMSEVTAQQRSAAKAINFGLLYGMSAFRLSRDLQIERGEAERYMQDYFGRMPEVAGWIAETHRQCAEEGFVTTLFGRRRLIPEIFSKNFNERSQGEREAVNTRVQGTAADVIKRAMVRADAALAGSRARMILQVHDELLIEAPEAEVDQVAPKVIEAMTGAAQLSVPLAVNWGAGRTWSEAHG